MKEGIFLGIDIGSVAVKTAVVSSDGNVLKTRYIRIKGEPIAVLHNELAEILPPFRESDVISAGITGSGGRQAADALGAIFTNEILCQAAFVERFHPDVRTVIEMGGHDSKLISLVLDRDTDRVKIEDFSMNTACAAGTGSFLDQQASRLRLTIEEFGRIALESKNPPPLAGRCSVFAKSDMIHLQQIAAPDYDIVAGLCFAVARNFKATVGKGKGFEPPVLFLGGVAANLGMQRAFRETLGLSERLIVPQNFNTSAAVGAALMAMQTKGRGEKYRGRAGLEPLLEKKKTVQGGWEPLVRPSGQPVVGDAVVKSSGPILDAYLGVDVGSVSTNVVVIDKNGRVLSKRYLPTAGRPIEAVKQGLFEVGEEIGGKVRIVGAGTTGSGRYLTGDMIGADIVRNEITCQAAAAAAIDPEVDTIFEIGGQDSKYISLHHGAVVDFEMNKACAAGTGSFLEEQAERLGIRIKKEFEERAFCAASPCGLGERCTVFMESDLVHYLNMGVGVDDISAGLAYAIAQNYLNKVVAGRRIGERIFFQGGVASNKAVVAAFEKMLGKKITVPGHHEVTGAIGAALIAMREAGTPASRFKGFDICRREYRISTFTCRECANNCEIRSVRFGTEAPLFYGGRCEKYDVKRSAASSPRLPDLFAERERLLTETFHVHDSPQGPVVGIPRIFYLNDLLPFWRTFFSSLGCRVIVSERTNRSIINLGLEASAAESCFPSKAALGHISTLLAKKPDFIFIPSFIRLKSETGHIKGSQACPYVQAIPYITKASLSFGDTRILEPKLYLNRQRLFMKAALEVLDSLGMSRRKATKALELARQAQESFERALEDAGRRALSSIQREGAGLVVIGRSYNASDIGMNMNLPAKIRDLGVQAVPMDYLPLSSIDASDWEHMYWRSGQKILKAARFIKDHPHLHPVYITNFGCGPDSFIQHFFRQELGDRPFLQLELDEHSADAGAITRIEAFLDSIKNSRKRGVRKAFHISARTDVRSKKIFIPAMSDHAYALAASFRACGVEAEVLPESDEETVRVGKGLTSGKECFPLALTMGDMVKATQRPDFDPDKSAFFMPGGKGPCRFGQYNHFHRQVLARLGLGRVPVFSPMQDETMHKQVRMLDRNFVRMTWRGGLAVDLLQKALREHRPHERHAGESDRVYRESLQELVTAIEQKRAILPVLERAYSNFSSIETLERDRPVIGIVGEIYIRSNRFGNEDIVGRIEQLGGEAWVAPVSEWLLYLTETAKTAARMSRSWTDLLRAHLTETAQHLDERRFLAAFDGSLIGLHEPKIVETLDYAAPYIHHSLEGEAVLTVGKAIDYIKKGVCGVINVMPLTCMPGTISSALLRRVRERHPDVPILTIAYDGQKDSQTMNRLEAFMHQARAVKEKRRRSPSSF